MRKYVSAHAARHVERARQLVSFSDPFRAPLFSHVNLQETRTTASGAPGAPGRPARCRAGAKKARNAATAGSSGRRWGMASPAQGRHPGRGHAALKLVQAGLHTYV